MHEHGHFRVRHLRRLTDRVGLLRHAELGEPDSFSGYDTLDNALALRLAARLFALGMHDDASAWASTYLQFLLQAFRGGRGFCAHREPLGTWPDEMLSLGDLGQIARGLAAASNSDLPGVAKGRADTLWNNVMPDLASIRCPRAAAHWLIAIADRPPAEQRKLEDAAARLAGWLVEDCYYALRTSDWEWLDERWIPGDACLPHGLWAAYVILGDQRYARVAAKTTEFVITQLFEEGLLLPVGTRGGWPRQCSKVLFDQLPCDVAATVELLARAYDVTGSAEYAQYADYAVSWFTGNNVKGLHMLDDTTGGVYDALTPSGHARGQGARAIVSFLLAATAVAMLETPRIVDMGTVVSVG